MIKKNVSVSAYSSRTSRFSAQDTLFYVHVLNIYTLHTYIHIYILLYTNIPSKDLFPLPHIYEARSFLQYSLPRTPSSLFSTVFPVFPTRGLFFAISFLRCFPYRFFSLYAFARHWSRNIAISLWKNSAFHSTEKSQHEKSFLLTAYIFFPLVGNCGKSPPFFLPAPISYSLMWSRLGPIMVDGIYSAYCEAHLIKFRSELGQDNQK